MADLAANTFRRKQDKHQRRPVKKTLIKPEVVKGKNDLRVKRSEVISNSIKNNIMHDSVKQAGSV